MEAIAVLRRETTQPELAQVWERSDVAGRVQASAVHFRDLPVEV